MHKYIYGQGLKTNIKGCRDFGATWIGREYHEDGGSQEEAPYGRTAVSDLDRRGWQGCYYNKDVLCEERPIVGQSIKLITVLRETD